MEQTGPATRRALPASLLRLVGLGLGLAAAAALGPSLALHFARPALLDFGPNDADYVRGFRQDWERDGQTRFHWTSQSANITLPLLVSGEGPQLRLRFRRHFVEPANVRLIVEGRTVAAFEVRADPRVAYRVLETKLAPLEGRHPFILSIEAPSEIDRPLGLALDWIELERAPGTRFALPASARLRFVFVVLAAFLLPALAGASAGFAAGHALLLTILGSAAVQYDVLAFERVLRQGAGPYGFVGLLALLLVVAKAPARRLGTDGPGGVAGLLVVLVLLAAAIRYALLLHPRFFYPDVRVHAAFALVLARRGLAWFSSGYLASQYQLSLGLQHVGGHWYAFPYPPGLYLLASPLIAILGYRPEVAVSLVAATANSLEALVVFGIARRLGLDRSASLASSAVLPCLPLFLARLSLAYFPAILGHAVDAIVIGYLVTQSRRPIGPRSLLTLSGLLAASFLTYTQSLLNFAVLLALLILIEAVCRVPGWRARGAGLVAASILGGGFSFAVFYSRYVPTLQAMVNGTAVAEEPLLVDRLEQEERARIARGEEAGAEERDPHSGPDVDLWRGLRKAGWRLFVFYGPFAPIVVVALIGLLRSLAPASARFSSAWALTYLALNLASGGLPGPNLVRYNKDLEVVAPLACLALGWGVACVWDRRSLWARGLAVLGGLGWVAFGVARAVAYLTERFSLER